MAITIQAQPQLAPDIFEYAGNYFKLSRTIEGRRKELTEEELTKIKEELPKVIDDAIKNGSFDINTIASFDLNTSNNVFYVYNEDTYGPWDGAIADHWVRVTNTTMEAFTKTVSSTSSASTPNTTTPSASKAKSSVSSDEFFNEDDSWTEKRDKIIKNFKGKRDLIHAAALGTYARILEEKYDKKDHAIRILDPIIIQSTDQDDNPFKSHKKLIATINSFNLDPNLNTLYIPIHIGSYPGYRNGHWICAALTRNEIQADRGTLTPIAVVYDSLGKNGFAKKLVTFLGSSIEAEAAATPKVRHQYNGTDCGVHVLHFIDSMERSRFTNLITYLEDPNFKVNASNERTKIAKKIKHKAEERLFQTEKAAHDLRTVKDYHLIRLQDKKFIGTKELKKIHTAQLEEFKKDSNIALYEHYDWWVFPIKDSSQPYGKLYALDDDAIKDLKSDPEFMENYLESATQVLLAYGWEIQVKNGKYVIESFNKRQNKKFKIPEIRLEKMAKSFYLFNRDLYDALVRLSKESPIISQIIKEPSTQKAFSLNPSFFEHFFK